MDITEPNPVRLGKWAGAAELAQALRFGLHVRLGPVQDGRRQGDIEEKVAIGLFRLPMWIVSRTGSGRNGRCQLNNVIA